MRILKLTAAVEKQLLRARQQRDVEAERISARIIAEVRQRGDGALFAWAKKLDGAELRRDGAWISRRQMRMAEKRARGEFLDALRHAERNVRRVAERQLPQPWTVEVEPGVKIGQMVRPIDTIACYIPGGRHASCFGLYANDDGGPSKGCWRETRCCRLPKAEC